MGKNLLLLSKLTFDYLDTGWLPSLVYHSLLQATPHHHMYSRVAYALLPYSIACKLRPELAPNATHTTQCM